MNKGTLGLIAGSVSIMVAAILISAAPGDGSMTNEGRMTVVNTTSLAKDVKGFKGNTPLKIYIQKGRVVKIEALPNQESPNFFARARVLLTKWNGQSVSRAAKMKVDAVSGATYSSKAVIENVKRGLAYYTKNKGK